GGAGSPVMRGGPCKPRAGTGGGAGGGGRDVILRVDPEVFGLAAGAERPQYRAGSGRPGARNNRTGAAGRDLVLSVPEGTVVRDERGMVADLVGADSQVTVARGGRGGRGNVALAGPRNRVPRVAERGEAGEEHRLDLELR